MRSLYWVFAAGLAMSACASSASSESFEDAILNTAEDNAVREAIRTFVREEAGDGVIARPDSLTLTPELELVQRLRNEAPVTREGLVAAPDFRLQRDQSGGCWLVSFPQGGDDMAYKKLPASAECQVIYQKDG